MTFTDIPIGQQSLGAAIREYQAVTLATAQQVSDLLSITAAHSGAVATNLNDLRRQAAIRLRYGTGETAVISTPEHDPVIDIFNSALAADSRHVLRSAIRLTHDLGFSPYEELVVGNLAVAAIRSTNSNLSPLAYRLASADHVDSVHAANTLGHPPRVHRDFVVRCAVLGLGDALNAEQDSDIPASVSVETWLSHARIRQQHR